MRLLVFLAVLAALLLATGSILAQIQSRSGEYISADDVIPDMAFYAARELTVTAKSNDDLFVAGGDITIDGAQADHMITAGGDITVAESAFHDLIIAGGNVTLISGTVTDDIVVAAGDLNVNSGFAIGGSAVISGGELTLETAIPGELRAAGSRVHLESSVGGDAHLIGDNISIGPNVRIGGDLRHRAQKIDIDPSAEISGEVIALEPVAQPDFEKLSVRAVAAGAFFILAFLIGIGVLVVVIVAALPALMNSTADMIREKPLSTLGIGFIVVAAAPLVMAFFFVTVFGIPLALLIAVIYAAATPLAIAAVAYFVGMIGRNAITKGEKQAPGLAARVVWTAIAVIALILVSLIPFLGQLFWLIAYVFGIGAVMTRGGKALALKA